MSLRTEFREFKIEVKSELKEISSRILKLEKWIIGLVIFLALSNYEGVLTLISRLIK